MRLKTKKKRNKTIYISMRKQALRWIKKKCKGYSGNNYTNEVLEGGYTLAMMNLLYNMGYEFENSPIIRKEKYETNSRKTRK